MSAKKKASFQDQLRGSLRTVIDLEAQERIRRLTTDEPAASQSDNPPLIRPVSKPESQPDKQTAITNTSQPAIKAVAWEDSRPFSLSDGTPESLKEHPSTPHIATLTNRQPLDQTDNQLLNPSKDQTQTRTPIDSTAHAIDQSLSQTKSHTQPSLLSQSLVRDRLNASQRAVLQFLLQNNPYIVKFREIGDCLGLGEATIRTILRRLQQLDFLNFKKARDGNLQGIRITFNQHLCEQFLLGQSINRSHQLSQSLSTRNTRRDDEQLTINQSLSQSANQTDLRTHSQPQNQTNNLSADQRIQIDRNKEYLSIENMPEEFQKWTNAFIELNWPNVYSSGFRVEQLYQALSNLDALGKKGEKKKFSLSLDHAEWELSTFNCLVDGKGEKVKNPVAFIYRALAQWGWFRAHADFKSQEEDILAQADQELQHRAELQGKIETKKFELWKKSLTTDELKMILENKRGPEEVWLRNYFREHIKSEI